MTTRFTTQTGVELGERVVGLEHGVESIERRFGERLDDGARRFASLGRQVEDIEERLRPKPADRWKMAGFVFGLSVALFTWVWQAARYPDRSEYGALAARVEATTESIDAKLQSMRETQLKHASDLLLLKQQLESLARDLVRIERTPNVTPRKRTR